jgi:hypothetical protein
MADEEKLSWLKINGEEAPTPREWTVVDSDFDSDYSVRDEVGMLHRTVIRTNQHSPKFKWRIQGKELSKLLKMINSTSLQVTYYDLVTKQPITITAYPQTTRQPKLIRQHSTYDACWWEFECSFIEY